MVARKSYPPFVKTLVSVAVASLFVVGVADAMAEAITLDQKTLDDRGKSAYATYDNKVSGTNLEFIEFSNSSNGGALVVGTNGEIYISDSKFESNYSKKGAGAVMTNGGHGSFTNVTFTSNYIDKTWDGGGAIKFSQATGSYSVIDSTFESNKALNGYGGAIYNVKNSTETSLLLSGNLFDGNSAMQGGAIYNGDKSNLAVITFEEDSKNTFLNNNATNLGGAIYNNSNGHLLFKGKAIFSKNKAGTVDNDIYNAGKIEVHKNAIVVMDGGIKGSGVVKILNGGSLYFAEDATKVITESSDEAVLSIAKSFEVNGTINVGTDVKDLTSKGLNFGQNSKLVLDCSLWDNDDSAQAFSNQVKMSVHDDSMLVIKNYQALTNNSDIEGPVVLAVVDESSSLWKENNIRVEGGTVLHVAKIEIKDVSTLASGSNNSQKVVYLVVDVKDAATVFPTLASSNSLDELVTTLNDENGDAPIGARMLRTLLFTEDTNTPIVDVVNEVSSSSVVIGVQNTALRLADTASNTVLDRMSLAQRSDAEGVNLWAVPMYGNLYSSDMVAAGASVRGQFGGVAVGADFEVGDFLGGKYHFGASFNVGGGQSKSKGTTISAKNNFDFGGVNVYGAWTKGAFNVIGSVGYGYGNHELALGLPMAGFASADSDVDTTALTADLRAEYLVKTDVMDILPHVGVRYTALKTDAHDLMVGGDVLNSVKADTQYIVQFPIGVTLSKDLAWSDWAVKPMIDLSVIPATGDKHSTTMVNFSGVNAWDNVNARVLDRMSWTGTLGVQAQKGNFTLGMNYGVQHASNETDQSVQVKLNWMF